MNSNRLNQEPAYPPKRLCLEPLSLNMPIPRSFSKHFNSETIINYRSPIIATDRINRTQGGKSIADIKQILSRSLFNKEKKRAHIQRQKIDAELAVNRSDTLPISPQTQQKCISARKIRQISNQNENHQHQTRYLRQNAAFCKLVGHKSEKKRQETLQIVNYSHDQMMNNLQQNQKHFSNTNELLDEKFNKLLQINYSQQGDMSLDIQSKFAMKKAKRDVQEVELLEPCVVDDRAAIHQKLLQQQNIYLRQQLITFMTIIDDQRSKTQELKDKIKTYKKQNSRLKQKNSVIQAQLTRTAQSLYELSIQNEDNSKRLKNLTSQKIQLENKFVQMQKQYESVSTKLQYYEQQKQKQLQVILQQKEKQKQIYTEQMSEKQKQISELNWVLHSLKNKITNLEQKCKQSENLNVFNLSTDIEAKRHDQNADFQQQFQRNSSICLSLAQAQSLKNIIEQKQQMFQVQIQTLKKVNLQNQRRNSKIIQQLNLKLNQFTKQKQNQVENIKKRHSVHIQTLQNLQYQNSQQLQSQVKQERQKKLLLINQIKSLEQKLEQTVRDEDQELEDLLQSCVNELQKQRHANYILREQIQKLKKLFTKQLYYIQQMEDKVYLN